MSTKALQDLLYRVRQGIATTGERLDAAAKELEAIEKAAKGLSQKTTEGEWNMALWDDAIDLMESIAKEAP